MNKKKLAGLVAVIAAILALLFPGSPVQVAQLGSAPSGASSRLATSSTQQVGQATRDVLFEAKRECASRIITTKAQPLYLYFDTSATASTTLVESVGHIQAASTTVAYDGGIYGCGTWTVKGAGNATTTILISEFR